MTYPSPLRTSLYAVPMLVSFPIQHCQTRLRYYFVVSSLSAGLISGCRLDVDNYTAFLRGVNTYFEFFLARPEGFEPPPFDLEGRCPIQLDHERIAYLAGCPPDEKYDTGNPQPVCLHRVDDHISQCRGFDICLRHKIAEEHGDCKNDEREDYHVAIITHYTTAVNWSLHPESNRDGLSPADFQ